MLAAKTQMFNQAPGKSYQDAKISKRSKRTGCKHQWINPVQCQVRLCGNQSFINWPAYTNNSGNMFREGPKVIFGKASIKSWKQSHNRSSLQLQRALAVLPELRHPGPQHSMAAVFQLLNHADLIRRECEAHCAENTTSVSSTAQSCCLWQEMGVRKALTTLPKRAEPRLSEHVTSRHRNTHTVHTPRHTGPGKGGIAHNNSDGGGKQLLPGTGCTAAGHGFRRTEN